MAAEIKLLSTDFDGTLFAEFENPPVPERLQEIIGELQRQGAKWVINTGRDLSSLLETLGRSRLSVKPDYLVLVEREIYVHEDSRYAEVAEWNVACTRAHAELFVRVEKDVERLMSWVNERFRATVYHDAYSPFCLIAENNRDANRIYEFLTEYAQSIPDLMIVRNDVYARFSHRAYNKGTALGEIARRLGIRREQIVAAGDHMNDMPMLTPEYAGWLIAPANAIELVKRQVIENNGYESHLPCGLGLARGLEMLLSGKTGERNS